MVLDDRGHDSWSGARRDRGGQRLAAAAQPGHHLTTRVAAAGVRGPGAQVWRLKTSSQVGGTVIKTIIIHAHTAQHCTNPTTQPLS